jgi:hypothetical protein
MRNLESITYFLTLLSLSCLPCFVGCGNSADVIEAEDDYISESVELFESELALEPGNSSLDKSTREEGLLFRINLLKTMGERAAAAVPALEKIRDTTQNTDLKQAATEALAEIQG